jgi:trigger factor
MAADATENTVVIEDAGPSRKKISITIPAQRVAEQFDTSLETLAAEATVPGFRKGRVPRNILEKRFGPTIREETRNQLVSSAYSEAVEQNSLRVLGEPEGADDLAELDIDPSKEIAFTVEVEVAPDFELPDLDGLEVIKPPAEVTDDMVEEQLQRVAQNEGDLESQEQAEPGDFCIGDGHITDDAGEELLTLNGAVIQIPAEDAGDAGSILGVYVEDFGTQVGLPKPGDEVVVKTPGPENHENPDLRGKDLTITFKIERVERIIPASIESLVARSGAADEQGLRESVTLQLNQRAVIQQQAAMREQIAQHLIESIDIDLPEKLTAQQADRNIQRQRMEMMYRGVDPMLIEQRMAEIRSKGQEIAQRELKLFFILAKVAEDMQIGVTQEEVNGRIAQIAAERGRRPQEMYEELAAQNQVPHIAQQIREHKAMDAVLSKAKVTEGELPAAGAGEPAETKPASKKKTTKKKTTKKKTAKKAKPDGEA